MFERSAHLYDLIYESFKDYEHESLRVTDIVQERNPSADTLLDVACGTGLHLQYLRGRFSVEGLDLDPGLLQVARDRLPGVPLHTDNMLSFDLSKSFDVVTCLFSAIGYCGPTVAHLEQAVARMASHLAPGGILIVEPWFTPEQWKPGQVHARFIDLPELKVVRMNAVRADPTSPRDSTLQFHYLVGTPEGVEYLTETHSATLFTEEEYLLAFAAAGLEVEHDTEGLMGRGLYIGRSPSRAGTV